MAGAKRLLPAIMVANDLLDGEVVFLGEAGWSRDPAEACVAQDDATADTMERAALSAMAARHIVDAALVDVTIHADGRATPNHFRERFRLLGPTNRPDLGKQSQFPAKAVHNG